MKGAILAAAALFGSAVTASLHGRHAHEHLHGLKRGIDVEAPPPPPPADNATCGCTTYVTTITGQGVLALPTTTLTSTTTNTISVYATTTASPLPTPFVTTCPTPGVYTFPATTITITEETTVCGATTTSLPPGNDVYGGVTTIVETATTVVCPYATVSPVGGTVTSIIETTTYVCPSAGTYTIAPMTTSVSQSTVMVYPTPVSYPPGTYTFPATVVTVTETDFVYICPFTSSSAAPAPTAAPPAPAAPAPAQSSAAAAPAPAPSSSSSTGVISGTGDKWCMTYSPYTADGQCKDAGAVEADISVIASKGFGSVRIYSTDCSGLQNVGSSCRAHGLKLVLGIFISETGIDGSRSQLSAIQSWAQFDLVTLVVVGNECIFNQYCSAGALSAYILEVKGALSGSGYSGPVTTTEPVDTLQSIGSQLCGAVDVMGANAHPFFNSGTSADQAGTFLQGQIEIVAGICSGKEVFVLETGWPHAGEPNGAAVPGMSEQAAAIKGIVGVAGKNAAIFSFEDDLWKNPGAFGVERSWGCSDQFA